MVNMKKYDIFICYRGESGISCELGSRIYNEVKRYNVFFAPMCINKGDNFKSIVPKVMNNISVVLLLLDKNFFQKCNQEDDIVMFELNTACQNNSIIFLPIFINNFNFSDVNLSSLFDEEFAERIKHINGIDYNGIYDFNIQNDLLPIIDRLYDGGGKIKEMSKRNRTRYYSAFDTEETSFLSKQQNMLYEFDNSVYENILKDKTNICVLDVGCNTGVQTHRRFLSDKRISKVVGIDRDESCITAARQNYPDCYFEIMDIEEADFKTQLNAFCSQNNIDGFNLINISMVLLHLEKPSRILRILKSFLKDDGLIFIRDIDDGQNFAYPDEEGIFSRMTKICEYCDMLGYRNSGRQIYTFLTEAGYRNIKLEKVGLNSSEMDEDEKACLFDVYYGYIPIALKKTLERTPPLRAKLDYEWVLSNIDNAFELFMESRFIFSLGYMIFTAKK